LEEKQKSNAKFDIRQTEKQKRLDEKQCSTYGSGWTDRNQQKSTAHILKYGINRRNAKWDWGTPLFLLGNTPK